MTEKQEMVNILYQENLANAKQCASQTSHAKAKRQLLYGPGKVNIGKEFSVVSVSLLPNLYVLRPAVG